MMRLLELEFEAGTIFNFARNFIYVNIVVGELTSHSFEIRKRRLVEEASASSSQNLQKLERHVVLLTPPKTLKMQQILD